MSLIDANDREQAINPAQSYIVQAPAGSGKTGLLVRRILALLSVVEKPEEILAITFTRKATAQMRERVIEALSKADKHEAFETHELDMQDSAKLVLARSEEKSWHLLHQPHRLKIQTIDALCAELVRKMPWSSRFGRVPRIETDLTSLYQLAAQNLIQKIDDQAFQPALSTLLFHANGNVQALKEQLANMLYQRQSWLRLIFEHKALDSRDTLSQHWQKLLSQCIAELEHAFGQALQGELLELARYAQEHAAEKNTTYSQEIIAALHDPNPRPDLAVKVCQWRCIVELLYTPKGFRKTVNKNNGFPSKDEAKLRLVAILTELQDEDDTYRLIDKFRLCPVPQFSDAQWSQLSALNTALPALAQELYVLMSERNCADYDELSLRAIDALGDIDQPTDLALIQDYQLKHILMDEFQDTSPTQLQLLKRLTAGWQVDAGRSLFFVGDPMQSIYGFRKADVRVFLQVRDQGINDIHPKELNLSVNFRSSPDIIDWVNSTMQSVFPRKDEPNLAKVTYSPSSAHHQFDGAVQFYPCIATNGHCEAGEILVLLQTIRTQHPKATIAVLARKRAPLSLLAQRLRQADFAFEAIELETLAEQIIVQDLISLAGVFLQPMESLAWLAVMRAPWCGANLNDLTLLATLDEPIMVALAQANQIDGISNDGKLSLARLNSMLTTDLLNNETLPLSERLHRAWLRLRAPGCYDKHELAHSEHFFTMLTELESASVPLTRQTLQSACAQYKVSSPTGKIKLMTLHKAKGLEFDHVILTGLASQSGGDNRQQALLLSTTIDDALLVACSDTADQSPPTKARFIKHHQQSIDNEEAARLVYVAVTRARQHLYLFATLKRNVKGEITTPRQGSLLRLLWPALHSEFENSVNLVEAGENNASETKTSNERPSVPLLRLPIKLKALELPRAISFSPRTISHQTQTIEFDWAQEDARLIGLVVHKILESTDIARLISWQQNVDLSIIRANLIKAGLAAERLKDACKRVSTMLQTMATDDRAHWLFDAKHSEVKSEWALSCQQDGAVANFIIDRSFVDNNGVRWIIDIKTSSHQGSDIEYFLNEQALRHAPQIDQYAKLIHALEPDRDIRLGLYFPALSAWRERKFIPISLFV